MSDDVKIIFDDLVAQCGPDVTVTTEAICRKLAIALSDDSATPGAIAALMGMLPGQARIGSDDDGGRVHITVASSPSPSVEQVAAVVAALREYNPSQAAFAQLVEQVVDLQSRVDAAITAFGQHDYVRLRAALYGEADPDVGAAQAAASENAALRAEIASLKAGRLPPPGPKNAPAASAAAPGAARPLTPAEAPDCRPPYAPGQGTGDNLFVATAPSPAERFSFGGRGE